MKYILALFGIFNLSACIPFKQIEIPDSKRYAYVTQHETNFKPHNEVQVESPRSNENEKQKIRASSLISEYKDSLSYFFSFKIDEIDSLGKYLIGLPDNFIQFQRKSQSLLLIKTKQLYQQPKYNEHRMTFELNFEQEIVSVNCSKDLSVFWDKKNNSKKIVFTLNPKKLWRKQRVYYCEVELN